MKSGGTKRNCKKEFYKLMKKVTIASLRLLKKRAEKKPIQPLLDYDIEIDFTKKSWKMISKLYYPSASFVKEHIEEILNLPEAISCINFMVKNNFHEKIEIKIAKENGKIVKDFKVYKILLGEEVIGTFLMEYVKNKDDFYFNEETFDNLYNELEEYIYTSGREMIVTVPLLNFELKDAEIVNLEDFVIRRLTEDEIKRLLKFGQIGIPISLPYGGLIYTLWCIELKTKFQSKRKPENSIPRVEKIITALRLFKRGSLGYSGVLEYPKVWKTMLWQSSYGKRVVSDSAYELANKDAIEFKKFWNKFKNLNIKNYPFLDVAIRRFNFSYDKGLPEDKLIDFITTFEALFLPEKDELSYRLALRCAYFLGENKKRRAEIFKMIKKAYDVRSRIIHGESPQSKSIKKILNKLNLHSLGELSMQMEDYLRESIKKFLNYLPLKTHKKIIEEIDSKIITGA